MPDKPDRGERFGGSQPTAPAVYPNSACYFHLLWLGDHEKRSGYSEESRHTTGDSGYDFAWKPGFPKGPVILPPDYGQ